MGVVTPPSTAARTEMTMPPTWENGRTSDAASRISRAQTNTGAWPLARGATTHQAMPSGANRASWTAMTAMKPHSPIGSIAAITAPTLK